MIRPPRPRGRALKGRAIASAGPYVVFKSGTSSQGVAAVKVAGGKVVRINKLGIGTVRSDNAAFARRLRASGKVVAAPAMRRGSSPIRGSSARPPR
jgi:hypothetical protein